MYDLIADESVDFNIVIGLRQVGIKVLSISESSPSISDTEVLALAVNYDSLLITEDKDFGELVFRLQLQHRGILLIRSILPNDKTETVVELISQFRSALKNKFAVLSSQKLRIRE